MPNGHGGIPKYGSPVLLVLALAGLLALSPTDGVLRLLRFPLAALLGWRLAWHYCMYDAMEYGGRPTPDEEMKRARRRYVYALVGLVPLSLLAVAFLAGGEDR